ncbi:hypothetical protein V5P93_002077 [Actinokineospora auranticolor]|uniref:AAA+ ATPase domain-containing protein n=1 Tax=Actinokineospora auranticolor TaxID=155976 RepID=A0A2S6GDJ4_9PSEU|nr:hypothetical protein [Actinokineospora auranticolor]PPK63279.1 hypothetical protein CLV40_13071 [Actinokineospora auranticolor]
MASDNALTYEGALRILGKHDQKWLKRVDALLGGVILGSGVVALLANPVTAPVVFAALWGWVDQKNEAIRLVSQALDALPGKRRKIPFTERVEQMTAAHTVLVVSSYFEALREALGDDYDLLELSEADKANVARGVARDLYAADVPKPGAKRGFTENLKLVQVWLESLHTTVLRSFGHLLGPKMPSGDIGTRALERYQSHYLALAAEIPEFGVWAAVVEHTATRDEVRALREDLLSGPDAAMSRLERALATLIDLAGHPSADLRDRVARANRSVLSDPILPRSTGTRYGRHLTFPTIEQAFLTPSYRFAVAHDRSRPADDTWWAKRTSHDDLHVRLAAHLASTEAITRPLLILGHPGAGKSLLTKVLAARLPAPGYTVVRVPLRHVDGHSPVRTQIQLALDRDTGGRVPWSDLVDQSADTVRVVILDGLDELLQQTHTRLYGYLDEVAEFQRREADQGHPVAVVVTTRTLACDRVSIAEGTTMIKLDDFDDLRIEAWLTTWHRANTSGIAAGTVREFPLETALGQRKLTAQPLLLMMMALYIANPETTMLDERLSTAELYRRLVEHFAEREAEKSPTTRPPDEIKTAVRKHLTRLSVAALGMLNRGRQDISAQQLEQDLRVLTGNRAHTDEGDRTLGEFFFVYTAEGRVSADTDQHYEFLHATFGEYLVASHVVDELREVARAAHSSRHWDMRTPDDDLLFAYLSHQSMAQQRPVLTFVTELGAELPPSEVEQMLTVLDTLLETHRDRTQPERHRDYLSDNTDQIARHAAYSANLLLLRLALSPNQRHTIGDIHRHRSGLDQWDAVLTLWQAGLSHDQWLATIFLLQRKGTIIELRDSPITSRPPGAHLARLQADHDTEQVYRYGAALALGTYWFNENDEWLDLTLPWLAAGIAKSADAVDTILFNDTTHVALDDLRQALMRIEMLLKLRKEDMHPRQAQSLVEFLLRHTHVQRPCGFALATSVVTHPRLLAEVPGLSDPKWFMADGVALLLRDADDDQVRDLLAEVELQRGTKPDSPVTINEFRALWRAYRWPDFDLNLEEESI